MKYIILCYGLRYTNDKARCILLCVYMRRARVTIQYCVGWVAVGWAALVRGRPPPVYTIKKNYRCYTYLGAVVRVHVFGLKKNERLDIRKTLVGSGQ